MQYTNLSKTKVRNALRIFIMMGLVKEGNKDNRSKTYYITEQGEEHYMAIFSLTPDELDKLRDDFEDNQETAQTECSISADVVSDEGVTDTDTINNDEATDKKE